MAMDKRILWAVIVVVVAGIAVALYPRQVAEPPEVELPPPQARPAPAPDAVPDARTRSPDPLEPAPEPEPEPQFVAEAATDAPAESPPLPPLDESDARAREVLARAAGAELVEAHLAEEQVIRKLVTTVDNLAGGNVWIKARAVPPVGGPFLAGGSEEAPVLGPRNFARYDPIFRTVEQVDATALAAAYRRHYPLLQQAYEELGYPGRQFHTRALEIIAHLLSTPDVRGPIPLERPHVLYRYADPELESLSSGQKIMLRIGPANRAIAIEKLIQLRAALEEPSLATGAD